MTGLWADVNCGMAMPREIEIKVRLEDREGLRERLTALGGRFLGLEHETNAIFDTVDGRLRRAGCGLRIRQATLLKNEVTVTLTFKGPRRAGAIKDREELETRVEDAHAAIAILERLGFQRWVVYEKRRETWMLDDAEVTIDELPQIGLFVEIEGATAESVDALRRRLGFSDEALVHQSYVELAATEGVERDGARYLRFGEGGDPISG
jgi:adenylate cyclase class 2